MRTSIRLLLLRRHRLRRTGRWTLVRTFALRYKDIAYDRFRITLFASQLLPLSTKCVRHIIAIIVIVIDIIFQVRLLPINCSLDKVWQLFQFFSQGNAFEKGWKTNLDGQGDLRRQGLISGQNSVGHDLSPQLDHLWGSERRRWITPRRT